MSHQRAPAVVNEELIPTITLVETDGRWVFASTENVLPPVPRSLADWLVEAGRRVLRDRGRCMAAVLLIDCRPGGRWTLRIPRQHCRREPMGGTAARGNAADRHVQCSSPNARWKGAPMTMLRLQPVFHCPYCPRGSGIIAADVNAVATLRPDRQGSPWRQPWSSQGDVPLLVFDVERAGGGGGAAAGPCTHLIHYHVDAAVVRAPAVDGGTSKAARVTRSWKHDWFTFNDRDSKVTKFLLMDVVDRQEVAFHPPSPHRIRIVQRTRPIRQPRGRVQLDGMVIAARDAVRFLEELRDGLRRRDEFYAPRCA